MQEWVSIVLSSETINDSIWVEFSVSIHFAYSCCIGEETGITGSRLISPLLKLRYLSMIYNLSCFPHLFRVVGLGDGAVAFSAGASY